MSFPGPAFISVTDAPYNADPTGTSNSTDAFAAASAAINAAGGGTLWIPHGTYLVGKQTLTGITNAQWAYEPKPIIAFDNCTSPIAVIGNGARLVCADGLRFGSFDPITGQKTNPSLPYYTVSARATPYTAMIGIANSPVAVRIENLELDGNANDLIIGGQWGDTGRQIQCCGITSYGHASLVIENVLSHRHALDGLLIGDVDLTVDDAARPVTLTASRFLDNARQGLSWVGGNSLTATACSFSRTGRLVNADLGGPLVSAPAAGLDIEAEDSVCRNGLFVDCEFVDNHGAGVLAESGDGADCVFQRCRIVGTTFWSLWARKPGLVFEDTLIVGAAVNPFPSADAGQATKFIRCRFTSDNALAPNGTVFGNKLYDFGGGGQNVLLDTCRMDALGAFELGYSTADTLYRNCAQTQAGTAQSSPYGIYEGVNTITSAGLVYIPFARYRGRTTINGTVIPLSEDLPLAADATLQVGGNRADRARQAAGGAAATISAAPTQADFNALVGKVNAVIGRLGATSGHGLTAD